MYPHPTPHPLPLPPSLACAHTLTEFGCSFVHIGHWCFGGQVGSRTPGGQGTLACVKLLSEKLLQFHANLDQVRSG